MEALEKIPFTIDRDNLPSIPENLDQIEDSIAQTEIDNPHVYLKIGVLKSAQEENSKALTYFKKALELAEGTGNPQMIAECLLNLAIFYLVPGAADISLEYSKLALEKFIGLADRKNEALVYRIIGEIYTVIDLSDNDLDVALQYFDQASQLHETLDDRNALAKDLYEIGQVYRNTWDVIPAREYLQKAKECLLRAKFLSLLQY